jgi:hypothetical protein
LQNEAWRKEALVLWQYNDRLLALLDGIECGRFWDLLSKRGTARRLKIPASARAGPLDAKSLEKTLQAVNVVESYLFNTGRVEKVSMEEVGQKMATDVEKEGSQEIGVEKSGEGVFDEDASLAWIGRSISAQDDLPSAGQGLEVTAVSGSLVATGGAGCVGTGVPGWTLALDDLRRKGDEGTARIKALEEQILELKASAKASAMQEVLSELQGNETVRSPQAPPVAPFMNMSPQRLVKMAMYLAS